MDRDQAMLEGASFLQKVFLDSEDITRCQGAVAGLNRAHRQAGRQT
jgi:hypothetical protein